MVATVADVGDVDRDETLQDTIHAFLRGRRTASAPATTVKAYSSDLAIISNHLAVVLDVPVDELMVADFTFDALEEAFAVYADTHQPASIRRAWSVWKQLGDYVVSRGFLGSNPMSGVPHPKASTDHVPHSFSETQMAHLLQVLKSGTVPARKPWPVRDYAVIAGLAVTGLRAMEFVTLTFGNIVGEPGQRYVSVVGKGQKARAVPLDPRLEMGVGAYLQDRWRRFGAPRRSGWVDGDQGSSWLLSMPQVRLWVGDDGDPMTISQLEHLVRRSYRAAGLNGASRPAGALIHALRHTFATQLVENGVSAPELRVLLGHQSLATTQLYLDSRPQHLRAAVAAHPMAKNLSLGS